MSSRGRMPSSQRPTPREGRRDEACSYARRTTLAPPAMSPTGASCVPEKRSGGGSRHRPGTGRGRHPAPGGNPRTVFLTSAPHGANALAVPRMRSPQLPDGPGVLGSARVRSGAWTCRNGARPARPEGCRRPAGRGDGLRTCMSSAAWRGRWVTGSLLAGLKRDALLPAARPSFRSGNSAATPEPAPGGCGGTCPAGAAAFPSGRRCREAVWSVMRSRVCRSTASPAARNSEQRPRDLLKNPPQKGVPRPEAGPATDAVGREGGRQGPARSADEGERRRRPLRRRAGDRHAGRDLDPGQGAVPGTGCR